MAGGCASGAGFGRSDGTEASTVMRLQGEAVKVHHLVKAPENTDDSIRVRESWAATELATVYTTPERLPTGENCKAATVILRTKGCVWWWKSGCTFCGYFNDVRDDVTSADLHAQWQEAKRRTNDFDGCSMVKVYTSGTFFEDRENPPDWQEMVLRETHERGFHLVVEARAEMCTPEKIAWVAERHPGCTVAIGLEAYDDAVLKFHCNKGFSTRQYDRAVETLRDNDLRVKTYLLFKPPFMSEGDALQRSVVWIGAIAATTDEISVNPMNIQRRTIVDRMFRNREYRPPWLWSLVEMIRSVHPILHPDDAVNGGAEQTTDTTEQSTVTSPAGASANGRLIVHPTAAGRIRGAHNCGICDKHVAAAIERYSVSADLREFDGLECDCQRIWRAEVDLDGALPCPLGTGRDRRAPPLDVCRSP